jgi:hypothetical protein
MIPLPPDTLNDIGVRRRREIEARILIPLIESLGKEFGREKVLEIVRQTIITIARGQGAALAQRYGSGVNDFAESLANWKRDDALEMDVLEQSDGKLSFNVTRCRYAEMYRALGIPELGAILSCNRDESLIEGFNDEIKLTRTQTIMQGAACCDFRYEIKK